MPISNRYRLLSRISGAAAVVAGLLAVLTLVNPAWIEATFGADPDGGGGELEWVIVLGLATFAAVTTWLCIWSRRVSMRFAVST
jgi:hypothetical protein